MNFLPKFPSSVGSGFLAKLVFAGSLALSPSSAQAATFALGADVGWLSQMEASGVRFFNAAGTEQDCLRILQGVGIDSLPGRLTNLSVLKPAESGGSLTLGFTIGGATARTVLLRAIGPGLAGVGVSAGTLADPQLALFDNGERRVIASNDDWGGGAALVSIGARVGAFAVADAASKDAMLLVTLDPGGYSATASGGGGLAIVEVYEVP